MPRTYVNNAYNRSVGRVGMPVGSCVVSRGASGGGSSGGSYGGGSSASSASASPRSYVDNSYNRSLGRVGLPVGTASVSRSSASSSRSSASSSVTSTPDRTYVDNAFNRREGRVGLPIGSASISRSSPSCGSSSPKRYADNAYNRRLGRVGLPLGSAPMSNSTFSHSTSSGQNRTYVDNSLNRRLGRVGKPIGTAIYSPSMSESRCNKVKNPIFKPLFDFDPENPTVITNVVENLTIKMEQNKDKPEIYFDCEKALGILNRHDAAIALSRSKTFQRPEWLRGGEIINWEDLEIGAKLGSGGFGDVHVAIWKGRCQVVIKKLRVQRVHEKKRMEFQREIKVISSLNHPSVVQFYGACIVTPNIGIVMEFLAGGSLHDVIHVECRQLTLVQKLDMTEDILSAIKYIHGENVAHRDIKAMNVLVCEDLNHCKLGDFGLALKESNESSLSSVDHAVVGTLRYNSPELLRGERLTLEGYKAADIYSASLTIDELFIEEEPFDGLNQHQIRRAVLSGERPEPSNDSNLRVPQLLKVLLDQGMSGRVNERPKANDFLKLFNEMKPFLVA